MQYSTYSNGFRIERPEKPPSTGTPGFFQAKRQGKALPVTPWSRRIVTGEPATFSLSTGYRNWNPYQGVWRDPVYQHTSDDVVWYHRNTPSEVDLTGHRSLGSLRTESLARAKSFAWDVGTFALEAGKTYDLVARAKARTHERVMNILNAKRRTIRTAEEFASAWLEYRYGWRPLNYDLGSAQEAYDRFVNQISFDRGSGSSVLEGSAVIYNSLAGGFTWRNDAIGGSGGQYFKTHSTPLTLGGHKVSLHWKSVRRVSTGVEVDTSVTSVAINPLVTGWELVPYSFVIDWFVNVGDVLAAVSPTVGRSAAWCCYSQRTEYWYSHEWVASNPPDSDSRQYLPLTLKTTPSTVRVIDYDRYSVDAAFVPTLEFRPQMSLPKFADLATLASSRRQPWMRL